MPPLPDPESLRRLLDYDPLAEAEKKTGVSYKDSPFTSWLGMADAFDHNRIKREALAAADDSHSGTSLDEYLSLVARLGFACVYRRDFDAKEDQCTDTNHVWFDERRGILLHFDTYTCGSRTSVNGGNFYYNWRPHDQEKWYAARCTSSGCISGRCLDSKVWVGHHDCREAIRFNLGELEKHGSFVTPWIERPFLWFLTYMDTKTEYYDYISINEAVIAQLPPQVRDCITPEVGVVAEAEADAASSGAIPA